jgi:serine/threonine protein kinase
MFISSHRNTSDSSGYGSRPVLTPRGLKATETDFDDVELQFLRVVGRNKVSIIPTEEIKLKRSHEQVVRSGATAEVQQAEWKGQCVVVKYLRHMGHIQDYSRNHYDLNFEMQLLSKPSLRQHRNIPRLLGVTFSERYEQTESTSEAVYYSPGLVVELAHTQYPDLRSFFDYRREHQNTKALPFDVFSSLVADIADGLAVLHDHDIVHADLKPENILLFPDPDSPSEMVAKVSDFGFVGMVTYNNSGTRAPLPGNRPRGATAEWSAPECLTSPDPYNDSGSLQHPTYEPCSDIYSFGLVSVYIALDGESPSQFVSNLSQAKISDTIRDVILARLEEHHFPDESDISKSTKWMAITIAENTLLLDWTARLKSTRSIRTMLSGG